MRLDDFIDIVTQLLVTEGHIVQYFFEFRILFLIFLSICFNFLEFSLGLFDVGSQLLLTHFLTLLLENFSDFGFYGFSGWEY